MKFKSKLFYVRRRTVIFFAITALSIVLLCKFLSLINIEEGLITIANNKDFCEAVLNTELKNTLQSPTAYGIITSQSPLLSKNETSIPEIQYTPWQLQLADGKTFPIKTLSVNPTSPKGYVNLGKIYLKNDSSKQIDLNWYLKSDLPFKLSGSGAHVLIVHTHGSESYLPSGKNTYTPEDVERTTDTRYNVVRVGDEIESILKKKGISVIHDRNIYDSPSYSGSYTRTLDAIGNHMKKNPGIKVVLDIHRDSICAEDGTKYKTLAQVNGKDCAQLMLVLSTGESGLPHPDWQENLKFGVKLQCQIANKYPGLMRPINLRRERFNMHATKGSLLVEVGSSANTLDEALIAIRPFAEELAALLLTVKK